MPDLDGDQNPTKTVQPSCSRARKSLTNAEKLSADARRLLNKKNADALQVELDALFLHRKEEVARLSQTFSKSPDFIQRLLNMETNYQKSRAPSLQNALIHYKSEEVNGGMFPPLFDPHDMSNVIIYRWGDIHSSRDTGDGG